VAELLIDRMDPNKIINLTMSDSSPLHFVCKLKVEKYTIIKKLLEKIHQEFIQKPNGKELFDKILKKEDSSRQTILHLSIENNHLNIVELLFSDYNIVRDLKDGLNGNFPIHLAAKNGSCEMFYLLQKYDAVSFKTNNNLENALHIAAFHNRSKFICEFLKYEKSLLEPANENDKIMPCICICESLDRDSYIPCIKVKDINQNTPLLTALATLNQRCVEELMQSTYCDVNEKDINGNSVYHICTEHDNAESLKYLLHVTNSQNDLNVYGIKNSFDDTILHSACRNGNLELVKLIMNKLNETNAPIEDILYSKNKDGQTCFHIAAEKGYFNIVEYFLKEKKLLQYIEHIDNNSNSSLHSATSNGHSSIVQMLLDLGADANAKNEENVTALDLSCRKGFFEISKNLITTSNLTSQDSNNDDGDYPLHVACYEGAHEVVKLLLLKGAKIDQLNQENKNCLDIAINRGHREVIRVLLSDINWYKLIRANNLIEETEHVNLKVISHKTSAIPQIKSTVIDIESSLIDIEANNKNKLDKTTGSLKKQDKKNLIESPQLVALFEAKMWDMFKIILDNCQTTVNEWNFSLIDPSSVSVPNHPLMLIARSGQENLLKHETTKLLLQLKWRFIPRCAFYMSLTIYLFYLILFSLYSVELSKIGTTLNMNENKEAVFSSNNFFYNNIYMSDNKVNETLIVNKSSINLFSVNFVASKIY
jgi:ankyrin repeat protein